MEADIPSKSVPGKLQDTKEDPPNKEDATWQTKEWQAYKAWSTATDTKPVTRFLKTKQ